MLSANADNPEGAKALLACLATGEAQVDLPDRPGPDNVAAANGCRHQRYTPSEAAWPRSSAERGSIAQFLDRDTRPDFAGPTGMQGFLRVPVQPGPGPRQLLSGIQAFYDTLPPDEHRPQRSVSQLR